MVTNAIISGALELREVTSHEMRLPTACRTWDLAQNEHSCSCSYINGR